MATYNNIKKIKIGDNIFNLYDSGNSGGTITEVKTTAGAHTVIDVSSGIASFNVPTKVSDLTNDSGFITSADVPEGASAYTGTISAVGTSASNGTSNGFARGDHVHNITKTTIDTQLGIGSGTTKFYREDGTWATPAYTTNTDTKLQVAAVTSGTTYYPIVGTGTTAATRQYDTTGFVYVGTNGTANGSNGNALLTLGNSTASTTANWKKGTVRLYGTTAYYTDLISGAPSANRTITFPNATGTVALTSDIPTVSYPVTSVNSKTGAVSLTASDVGALSSSTTYVSTITTTAGTHSAISSKSGAVSFNVPTKTSHLTNDSGFITSYTDENMKWTASTSTNTYYPLQSTSTATTSTANTLNSVSFYQYYNTGGGYRRLDLGNATAYKSSGGAYGTIRLYGAAATYYGDLVPGVLGTTSGDGHISANRTWTLPDKTGTIALTSDIPSVPTKTSDLTNDSGFVTSSGVTSIATSSPISGGTITGTGTISHATSGVGNAVTTAGFYKFKYDTYGHVTGVSSVTASDITELITIPTNTDSKLEIGAVTSGTTYYPIVAANSTTAATRQYDATGIAYTGTNGTANGSNGNALLTLGNNTASTTANWKKGTVRLYGTTAYYTDLVSGAPTANRTITFPNKTGTVALTDDIPSITDTNTTYTLTNALASHKFTWTFTAGGSGSGSTTTTAELVAGTGITLTDDTTNKKITIASSITNTDENVKSTAVTAATTNYIVGSTTSSTTTGGLSKHASAILYTTADSGTSGYTQLRLGNTTATTSAGGKEGQIRLYGTNATYYTTLKAGAVTSSNKTITFPNATGTVALTSDIPTVPTKTSDLTNDSGFITASHTSTYSLPLAASGTRGGVQIGYSESGTNYAVKLSSEKMYVSVPWTDTKVTTDALTSGTTYYPILATGTGTATRQIDSTLGGLKYTSNAGSSSTIGAAILQLGNTGSSGTANNEHGVIRLYGNTSYYTDLVSYVTGNNNTIALPSNSGTVMLVEDVAVYVIEKGTTSNDWDYRLWSDGTYEAWRSYGFTNITVNTSSAGTYYNSSTGVKDLTVPQFSGYTNTSVTYAQGTENESTHSSGVYIYAIDKSSATGSSGSIKITFRAHASTSTGSCGVDIYIKGTYS